MSRARALQSIAGLARGAQASRVQTPLAASTLLHRKDYSKVPEYWGRDSPYHGGTEFLGTPANHLELVAKRPLSPDVFELGFKGVHYRFPPGPISSVLNRATGVALFAGAAGAGVAAVAGELPAALAAAQATPLIAVPIKFAVAFPLIYHFAAGIRHFYWDHYTYGPSIEKNTPLEVPAVAKSSVALIGGTVAVSALISALQF